MATANPKKPFILVRQGPEDSNRFSKVVICDTRELVPAIIDGRETRVYKPVSEVLDYFEAHPRMVALNGAVS